MYFSSIVFIIKGDSCLINDIVHCRDFLRDPFVLQQKASVVYILDFLNSSSQKSQNPLLAVSNNSKQLYADP